MVASIPWQVYSKSPALVQQTQKCLTRLLRLLNTLSDIAIPILATPEENNVGAQDVDDIVTAIEQESSVDGSGVAPTAQVSAYNYQFFYRYTTTIIKENYMTFTDHCMCLLVDPQGTFAPSWYIISSAPAS